MKLPLVAPKLPLVAPKLPSFETKLKIATFFAVTLSSQIAFAWGGESWIYYSPLVKTTIIALGLMPVSLLISSLAPTFDLRFVRAFTTFATFGGFVLGWSMLTTVPFASAWDTPQAVAMGASIVTALHIGVAELLRRIAALRVAILLSVALMALGGAAYGVDAFSQGPHPETVPEIMTTLTF